MFRLFYFPICRLPFNHPAGVFFWQGAYFVDLLQFICGYLDVYRFDIIL